MTIETIRAEFAQIHAEASKLVEATDLTAEQIAEKEAKFAKLDELAAKLADAEKLAKYNFSLVAQPVKQAAQVTYEASVKPEAVKFGQDEFNQTWQSWMKGEALPATFASITSASASGILIPREVELPVIPTSANVWREAYEIHGLPVISSTSTANRTVPVMDAAAGGAVAETDSAENENAPTVTKSIALSFVGYESGSVWFSNKELRAVDYNFLQEYVPGMVYSKELGLNAAISAAIVADAGITQSVATATIAGLTFANLNSLNRKLPKRYDRQKVIILSADAYIAAEGLVGSDGHPILTRDAQNETLLRFRGTPVLRDDNFEAFGANKVVGCVVSLIGFALRDATPVEVVKYENDKARPLQTGANLFQYHAYGYSVDAIAKLTCPAS